MTFIKYLKGFNTSTNLYWFSVAFFKNTLVGITSISYFSFKLEGLKKSRYLPIPFFTVLGIPFSKCFIQYVADLM